ncbi:MAG: exodeoxyribonuclease VII small subunit [Phycisphaerales bacterium]
MAQRKSKEGESALPPVEGVSFEAAMGELESIIDRIEQGEVGLEESLRQFRRGDALVKRCRAILDVAEQQVKELVADDSGVGGAEGQRASDAPEATRGGTR